MGELHLAKCAEQRPISRSARIYCHARQGNEENLFDRVDYQLSTADSIHLNFGYSRSWFQNPNSFDQQFHNVNGVQLTDPVTGNPLGTTDQVSQIKTFNIAPTWTRLVSSNAVFTFGGCSN